MTIQLTTTTAKVGLILFGGAGIAALVGLVMGGEVLKPCGVAREPVLTTGRVVRLEPKQHRAVVYEFMVNGTAYQGTGSADDAGRSFEALSPGDPVPVSYRRSNPGESVLGPAARLCRGARRTLVVIVGFVFCAVVVASLVELRRSR